MLFLCYIRLQRVSKKLLDKYLRLFSITKTLGQNVY
jgi:hypothetical protein